MVEATQESLISMTWLITGGTGQLGIALSKELKSRGISFKAWGSTDLDIADKQKVQSVIHKLSPKIIINCAAWTDVDGAEDEEELAASINSLGAENIALAARNCGAKLVHISTDYVFSGKSNVPWSVKSKVSPSSAYGRTKAAGEIRVLATYPENSYILRTAWLYSPWRNNFAKTMLKIALYGGGEVQVVNDQVGQPTSAVDVARQIIKLVEDDLPFGVYHGTNSGIATWFEFAQYLFELAGADVSRVVPVDSSKNRRKAVRPEFSVLDHQEWAQTSVQEMQNWKSALDEQFPIILEVVLNEGGKNA